MHHLRPVCCLLVLLGSLEAAVTTPEVLQLVSQRWYSHHIAAIPTGPDADRGFAGDPQAPTTDHETTRQLLIGHFQAHGWTVRVDELDIPGYTGAANIVATRTGSVRPNEQYLLGAHYDSAGNPGYADNATGVAALMEAARVLAFVDCEATMILVAFDAEEAGLRGSHRYAAAAIDRGDDLRAVLNCDMIGHNHAGNGIAWVGRIGDPDSVSDSLRSEVVAAVSAYGDGLSPVAGILGSSDHAAFDVPGFRTIPAVQLTEERDPEDGNRSFNPHYHQDSDHDQTPDNVDLAYATRMSRAAIGWLLDAAVPIDRRQPQLTTFARVQPVQVARSDGSDVVNAAEELFPAITAAIWAQAGVAIEHLPFNRIDDSRIWQVDTTCPPGEEPDERTIGVDGEPLLCDWEVMEQPGHGKSPDPLDLNCYFIRAMTNTANGAAVIGGNVCFIQAKAIADPGNGFGSNEPARDTIPHEYAHNLDLLHPVDAGSIPAEMSDYNLMHSPRVRPTTAAEVYHADSNPTGTSQLTYRQIAKALESPFIRPLPLDPPSNSPPTIAGVGVDADPVTGTSAELSVSASDPDDDPLTIEWTVTAQPGGSPTPTFTDPSATAPTITFFQSGAYRCTVTVGDGTTTVSDGVDITVAQTPTVVEVTP